MGLVSFPIQDDAIPEPRPPYSLRRGPALARLFPAIGAEMRIPDPDHTIAIAPNPKRVRVRLAGTLVADTRRALTLREASLPPVHYIPREDVDLTLLSRTEHGTHCPYKGDATYFTSSADGRTGANAVRSYEE